MSCDVHQEPVTVIVPTRDRPLSLARCLEALELQEGVTDLQVLVVDDGSRRPDEIATIAAQFPRVRLVRNERPEGAGAARNAGVRGARTEIVLFTDDDCEPAPDWASRLAGAVANGADAATGRLLNGRPSDPLCTASETIVEFIRKEARGQAGSTEFATANSLACTVAILNDIRFDEEYRYAEDRDWCARLISAGYSIVIVKDAVVIHQQDLTARSFWRRHVDYGKGAYRFRSRHAPAGLESPRYYTRLLATGFTQGVIPGLLVGVAQFATAVGFLQQALAERALRER